MEIFLYYILMFSFYFIFHNYLYTFYLNFFLRGEKYIKCDRNNNLFISIIIPIYNEEKLIQKKLLNTYKCTANLTVNFEVLIGSDGSTDDTISIAEFFIKREKLKNWHLYEFTNEGKCQTINKLVEASKGDLIISTDSDVSLQAHDIQKMIEAFENDARLGCLSCIPVFDEQYGKSQKIYWNQDLRVRSLESDIGMLIVVTGWFYGFRKSIFKPIPKGVMADDLWIPLTILLQNFKSCHDEAIMIDSERTDELTEIKRRRRVISGGIDVIRRLFTQLSKRPKLFFIVYSHKINRWLLPIFVSIFVLSLLAIEINFVYFFILSMIGLLLIVSPKRFFYYIYAFLSPLLALIDVLRKEDFSRWDHTRK